MDKGDFYTFNEYMKRESSALTASMEDYLEMIYRLSKGSGYTRMHDLSAALNVQPPSATKMVQKLGELKLLKYEKYGLIILEEEGKKFGEMLLSRHRSIEEFLRIIGIPESYVLEETEKMEHVISSETVECFMRYITFIRENPQIAEIYNVYIKNIDNIKNE